MTTVIFELPSVDASGSIIAGTYDYVGIHASSTEAYRLVDAAPTSSRVDEKKRLTNVLDAVSFSYDDANFSLVTNITASATTSSVVRGETMLTNVRERVYMRNI